MDNFFTKSKPIQKFLQFSEEGFYARAPEDWLIVITDVQGSTQAIEAGQYKSVNMAGASSIAAIVNALGSKDFPFVFGGDGATALIPGHKRDEIEKALRAARQNAQDAFQLNLRIGIIPHQELIEAGAPVNIARFQLPSGSSIAFFKGEGLGLAEKWVKSGRGIISSDGPVAPLETALKGLSCRWAPLKSTRGSMLSILVKPRQSGVVAQEILKKIVQQLDALVDMESPQAHPVKDNSFRPEGLFKAARTEARLLAQKPRWLGMLKVMVEMLLVRVLDRFGLKLPNLDFRTYKHSMISHSDFRKYDEMIRMVLDCTPEMCLKLRALLEKHRLSGEIFYGLFESEAALMTCFVQTLEDEGHIHFIDGDEGGYAMAAKEFKAQMKVS